MRYQEELGLSDEQRKAISATIAETQSKMVDLRWQSEVAAQKLTKLLKAHPIDTTQALAQVDEVLRLEQQLRRTNLAMLIAIRNTLTAEQQETLATLRPKQRPRGRPATRRPPGAPAPAER
jgi:Spy/CpxP family protein refolding chaperone